MLSATFRYLQTGTTVTFTNQVDIDSMKGHPEYERVVEDTSEAATQAAPEAPKKAGRPKKTETTAEVQ